MHVRRLVEADLPSLERLVQGFADGHPAKDHPRPREALRGACLGPGAPFRVLVADRGGELVGFICWTPTFDFLWSERGAIGEWLFVDEAARGYGVAVQLLAALCADVRAAGGVFVRGTYGTHMVPLYERIVERLEDGHTGQLAETAFHRLADLAGADIRTVVRDLRTHELLAPAQRDAP